jgi:hypothetical protein
VSVKIAVKNTRRRRRSAFFIALSIATTKPKLARAILNGAAAL